MKISQQMAKLCRKLKWLVFFWDTVYMIVCWPLTARIKDLKILGCCCNFYRAIYIDRPMVVLGPNEYKLPEMLGCYNPTVDSTKYSAPCYSMATRSYPPETRLKVSTFQQLQLYYSHNY